jgi:GR25 family glycosyltransferase involved in LPS biosynthesis
MIQEEIHTYIINLKKRYDRKFHVLREFSAYNEFQVNIVEAMEHHVGAFGLWKSIIHVIQDLVSDDVDYVLICEDDHRFTADYSRSFLFDCISKAQACDADILLGGASSVHSLFSISDSLLWVDRYTGNQFLIIFRKFFPKMIEAVFTEKDVADYMISSLTSKLFLIYPFISIQAEFGYSDITSMNNISGHVSKLFQQTGDTINYLKESEAFYGYEKSHILKPSEYQYGDISIPTYVLGLPDQKEDLLDIQAEFQGKSEFNAVYMHGSMKDELQIGKLIQEIIRKGIEEQDDILIICANQHRFTSHYKRDDFVENILKAHEKGIDLLLGGVGGNFGHALPVSDTRFWISRFQSAPFLVVYSKFFHKILSFPFTDKPEFYSLLSELTSNKMVIYPYISWPSEYSSLETYHNEDSIKGQESRMCREASNKLSVIKSAYDRYKLTFNN